MDHHFGDEALSAHVVLEASTRPERALRVVDELAQVLKDQFGIEHATLQLEPPAAARQEMPL